MLSIFLKYCNNLGDIMIDTFVGDVMGQSGRSVISAYLKEIKKEYGADFCILNAENASGYTGLVNPVMT
jgi:calcineurin-like phosphoesterase